MSKTKQSTDIYTFLNSMERNMEILSDCLNLEMKQRPLPEPKALTQHLQNVFVDKNLLDVLTVQNENLEKVVAMNIQMQKEMTSYKERVIKVDKERNNLLQKIEDLEQTISGKQKEINQKEQYIEQKEQSIEQKDQELLTLHKKQDSTVQQMEDNMLEWIKSIISLRDGLLLKEGLCADHQEEGTQALHKVLIALLMETSNLLKKHEVEVLDQAGQYDANIHIVTGVKATTEKELHDTVAETFRPGYRYHSKIIRPQEVVLYAF